MVSSRFRRLSHLDIQKGQQPPNSQIQMKERGNMHNDTLINNRLLEPR